MSDKLFLPAKKMIVEVVFAEVETVDSVMDRAAYAVTLAYAAARGYTGNLAQIYSREAYDSLRRRSR